MHWCRLISLSSLLLVIVGHCWLVLVIVGDFRLYIVGYCWLSSIISHYEPLPTIINHFQPWSTTMNHYQWICFIYQPLSTIVKKNQLFTGILRYVHQKPYHSCWSFVAYHPLSSTIENCPFSNHCTNNISKYCWLVALVIHTIIKKLSITINNHRCQSYQSPSLLVTLN